MERVKASVRQINSGRGNLRRSLRFAFCYGGTCAAIWLLLVLTTQSLVVAIYAYFWIQAVASLAAIRHCANRSYAVPLGALSVIYAVVQLLLFGVVWPGFLLLGVPTPAAGCLKLTATGLGMSLTVLGTCYLMLRLLDHRRSS